MPQKCLKGFHLHQFFYYLGTLGKDTAGTAIVWILELGVELAVDKLLVSSVFKPTKSLTDIGRGMSPPGSWTIAELNKRCRSSDFRICVPSPACPDGYNIGNGLMTNEMHFNILNDQAHSMFAELFFVRSRLISWVIYQVPFLNVFIVMTPLLIPNLYVKCM